MKFRNAVLSSLRAAALLAVSTAALATTYVGVFFDQPSIAAGGTAGFYVQLRENDGVAFANGAITITYPAGLVNDGQFGDPIFNDTCTPTGATVTRTAGTNQLVVTNVTLAAFSFCDIAVRVTSAAFGSYTVTVPPGSFSSSSPPVTNSATTSATLGVVGPVFVKNTADSGADSLRDAIDTVNANCGGATGVSFNIPGAGPHAIAPLTQLPAITCAGAVIDGYTQPGASFNTNLPPGANNASLQVELDGSLCSSCVALALETSAIEVRGLAIHSFGANAILSEPGGGTNYIYGNYIGIDAGGNARGNNGHGVWANSGYAVIGAINNAALANVISSNAGSGIFAGGSGGAIDAESNEISGNAGPGIYLSGADYSRNFVNSNRVTGNGGAGIFVISTNADVVIGGNQSFNNSGGIGIDINGDGPNANDEATFPYDGDGVLNYPVVTSVVPSGGNTVVTGYLRSIANRSNLTIYLYANTSPSPVNEGEIPIDSFGTSTDSTGVAAFTRTISGTWSNVSAQAVMDVCNDACYRSSEYSPKVALSNPLVVTNTNDSGTGSLRDAIAYVNSNCAAQTITFNIPGGGVHTIQPLSQLPALTCASSGISGYTQSGASPNSLSVGDNAVILVELNGALAPGATDGLQIGGPGVFINGLAINGFATGAGIKIVAPWGSTGGGVQGNFIGLDATGTAVNANLYGVWCPPGSTGLELGSSTPGGRNVIAGNEISNILLESGDFTMVHNNYVGTNAAGDAARGGATGIAAFNVSNTSILDNVVSGNAGAGIELNGAPNTTIARNLVGVSAAGTSPVANAGNGIHVTNSSGVSIGGAPVDGNVISGNAGNGIYVTGSNVSIQGNNIGTDAGNGLSLGNAQDGIFLTGGAAGGIGNNVIRSNALHGVVVLTNNVAISANSIFDNGQPFGGLGINLQGNGIYSVPINDNCDVDGGGNGLANYPVLASAVDGSSFMIVTGTLNSTANTQFTVDVFSSPAAENAANRSGRTYLGSFTATTDGACNASFTGAVNLAPNGDHVTATSTDPSGNTSPFSNAVVEGAPAPAPAISPSASGVTFVPQIVGTTSPTFTITLMNTGTATLTFSSIAFTSGGASYTQTNNCATPLASGTSCDVVLSFVPGAVGALPANLRVVSDASNTPTLDLALNGLGAAPPTFALSMGTSLTPGQTTVVSIRIQNPSGNSVTYANFDGQLTYPAGFVNDTPNASYPQGGCNASGSYTGGIAGGNTIGFTQGGDSVAPGVTCSRAAAQVIAPAVTGAYTFTIPAGGITVSSPLATPYSNPAPVSITVDVSAAPAPGVGFSPTSLGFASQLVGTSSASQPVTLTNTGNAALTISSIATGGDFSQANACPASLAAGGSCTIDVTFSPAAAGPRTGSLSVATNAAGSPHSVPLGGTGVAPAPSVSITPPSLAFAARTVSTTSPAQTITLANTGKGPLAISTIAISGDFAFTSACGASVAAGGSCTIDVTFTPLVAGPRTGSVTITDDASGSPHTAGLSGSGLGGAAAVASVSPGAVDFAPQEVGSESPQEIVTVSNTGSAPLTFSGVGVSGEFAIVTPAGPAPPACPLTLAPGESCRIALVFRPTGTNLRQGVLTIATNAATITVGVLGTGMIPEPPQLVTPASVDFGTQAIGTRSDGHSVALRNASTNVATITELGTSGDFGVSDTCTTIAPGATCSPLVTFQPTALGPRTGTLTIRTLRDVNPYHVQLTGSGEENHLPVLELSATRIGFGNAFIAMPVSHDITLRNAGQAPLLVSGIVVTGDYFSDGACVGSIAAAASCTVHVTFLPSIPGGRIGTVEITSNAAGSPHGVSLSGTGCFVPTPSRARFGVLLCGG